MTFRIRIIIVGIAVASLYLLAMQVRRRQIRAKYLVLWTSLCLLSLPLVLFSGAVDTFSQWLGIYYPPATLFMVAIIILFLVSVHFSREISRLEERTRILAEELALSRVEAADQRDGRHVNGVAVPEAEVNGHGSAEVKPLRRTSTR